LEGCNISIENEANLDDEKIQWTTILPQVKLQADHQHYFEKEIMSNEVFSHVRLSIFPDGGVSRMRLWGKIK
jgi:allantoicase